MSLSRYRAKRRFHRTPEPRGKRVRASQALTYVIQKHAASHLHFDFRLEWRGVLKSWAIPKGPSLNPTIKRLAVQVEDHPLDYANFSGRIPKGEYGAGEVGIWDRGHWQPQGDVDAGLEQGHLDFTLQGERLHGAWVLVRTRGDARKPQWLLIKRRDEHASAQGAELTEVLPALSRPAQRRVTKRPTKPAKAALKRPGLQLATLIERPPDGQHWYGELKLDGYRLLIHADGAVVQCWTRNGQDWSARVPRIVTTLRRLALQDAWLDGELVASDAEGHTRFQMLQTHLAAGDDAPLTWMAFDLLQLAGTDLRDRPLRERRRLLQQALSGLRRDEPARVLEFVEGDLSALWQHVCQARLEGLILKDPKAPYTTGRTRSWLKLKCRHEEEFVVGGYTRTRTGRETLTSLLLGQHVQGKFRYAGRVGSGFDMARLQSLRRRLDALKRATSPFANRPAARSGEQSTWVEPRTVVQVRYAERTRDGLLRQPIFVAEREDRDARGVQPENVASVSTRSAPHARAHAQARPQAQPTLTHPERVLFPEDGISKAQLADYYASVHSALWAHLAQRPVSIVRSVSAGKSFFQRHVGEGAAALFLPVGGRGTDAPYMRLRSAESILQLAQFGIVELHTWGSRVPAWQRADRLTFDLDPDPALPWRTLREAALLMRELLQGLELESRLKSSGGAGLHVVVPLARAVDFDLAAGFAQAAARKLSEVFPDRFTAVRGAARRRGRIFIDWQRNQLGATTVAAWSPRLRAGAPVSMPLDWSELGDTDLRAAHFNLHSAAARLLSDGDAWDRLAAPRQTLTARLLARLQTTRVAA